MIGDDLAEASHELMRLFEEHIIIRNTDQDGDFVMFTKQGLRIMKVLRPFAVLAEEYREAKGIEEVKK